MMRDNRSTPPPAGCGTTKRIGRLGYGSAAIAAPVVMTAPISASTMRLMSFLPTGA
jgi:hypothetical protein